VVTVEAALHGHRLSDVDVSGAGVGVEVEVGIAYGEAYAAAAGGELPVASGLAFGGDVAGACAGFECSVETVELDVSGAGLGLDVAGTDLLKVYISGSGAEGGHALNAVDMDVA